jgi:hypothetical protein
MRHCSSSRHAEVDCRIVWTDTLAQAATCKQTKPRILSRVRRYVRVVWLLPAKNHRIRSFHMSIYCEEDEMADDVLSRARCSEAFWRADHEA